MNINTDRTRPPIIAFSLTPWFGLRMNRQHVLSRLAARGWPVVYSNGALSVWDRGSTRWQEAPLRARQVSEEGVCLDMPGKLLPRWEKHPAWDTFAVRRYLSHLRRIARTWGDQAICYVFEPQFWPYVEALDARHVVFHAYDAYPLMEDWTPQLEHYQHSLLRRADLRIVTYSGIADLYPADVRRDVRELPNGVDESRITTDELPCPDDLAAIPHPRIGYFGAINPKVDFGALAAIARDQPGWHLVLVGPADPTGASWGAEHAASASDWRALQALPNVHYLGRKDFQEVTAYTHHVDVNVICYRTSGDGWWSFGSPNKFHEALATGRPVIASPLPTITPFSHVVDIAHSPAEWQEAIRYALEHGGVGSPALRRAVAAENTWNHRVDILEQWLTDMIARRSERTTRAATPHGESHAVARGL